MVDKSLENLEKSGNIICVRDKLEKLGKFTERVNNNFMYIFIFGNNAFADKNVYYKCTSKP